jgi:hypothetical protein
MNAEAVMEWVRPSLWQIVAGASVAAGIGSGCRIMTRQAELPAALVAALTMMLATFAGWYVWGFFTSLTDRILFGGHSDYRGTLSAFARAYVFQALFLCTFTNPMGWLWGWIALYSTVAAWGVVGPRRLGMRTWQAIVAATLGMLVWLVCLLVLTLTLTVDGQFIGVGAFLI